MSRDDTTEEMAIGRRAFLGRAGAGLGSVALASMLDPTLLAAAPQEEPWRGVVRPLHHAPRIRRVIHLCMAGGPSHLETLDHKPELARLDGQPMPKSVTEGQQIAQLQGQANRLKILGPQHPFRRYGESGQEISTMLPHIGSVADDICIIRSMKSDQINHDPAHTLMNTGTAIQGRPSMGSWALYGLGAEARDLPGFIVLASNGGGQDQPIAARQWSSGFLPSRFQGVDFQTRGVHYLERPAGVTRDRQRDVVDTVRGLNTLRDEVVADPEINASISQMEMAFRMQTSIPKLMDISDESKETLELYGIQGLDGSFGANCLMARRMAERGVRFIQVYHRGWDHHGGVKNGVKVTAGYTDRPTAALIKDLKRRGLLDDTLVIWGGEFGRTPMAQGNGRDHHIAGYSLFLAGGGIKGGHHHGATDELGYHAAENIVSVHDLHATMLHLLGVDHERLTYRYQGRYFRLTDVHGRVLREVLA